MVYDEQNILGQMLALKGSPFLGVLGAEGHWRTLQHSSNPFIKTLQLQNAKKCC